MSNGYSAKNLAQQQAKTISCPSCSHSIFQVPGEIDWCDSCDWNIDAISERKRESVYLELYRKVGRKVGKDLFASFIREMPKAPRLNFYKLSAFFVAGIIHSVTFLFLAMICFVFYKYSFWMALLMSTPLGVIFYVLVPKPRRLQNLKLIERNKTPRLYSLLDRISENMGTQKIHGIVINEDFNASYTEYLFGRWKKKVITIGLPLFDNFGPEGIVSILSHEVSHGANGDIARGVFIGSALRTLAQWYFMFTPRHLREGENGNPLTTMVGNLFGYALGLIPKLGYYILAHLLLRQCQEAEYLADRLASEVAGTEQMISALERIMNANSFSTAVSRAAFSNGTIEVFSEIKKSLFKTKSPREQERIRRLELKYGLSLDASHPPTPYRVDFLKAHGILRPRIVLSEEEYEAIVKELEGFKKEIGHKIIDNYLYSIS